MFPVRCYTCDAVIGNHWGAYSEGLRNGDHPADLLTRLDRRRMCCRRMFLSHVDLMASQIRYPAVDVALDGPGATLYRHVRGVRDCTCE